MTTSKVGYAVAGHAIVCCIHNQEKRRTKDLAFDPAVYKPQLCACCENLFLTTTDTPVYCPECGGKPIYPLGAPLAQPQGVL